MQAVEAESNKLLVSFLTMSNLHSAMRNVNMQRAGGTGSVWRSPGNTNSNATGAGSNNGPTSVNRTQNTGHLNWLHRGKRQKEEKMSEKLHPLLRTQGKQT